MRAEQELVPEGVLEFQVADFAVLVIGVRGIVSAGIVGVQEFVLELDSRIEDSVVGDAEVSEHRLVIRGSYGVVEERIDELPAQGRLQNLDTPSSPASFVLPYTLSGHGVSVST